MRLIGAKKTESPKWVAKLITWIAPLVIVAAGWLAYRQSFVAPFIFDDKPAILNSPNVRALWPVTEAMKAPPQTAASGRPVPALSFAINFAIGKYDVYGWHVFNLFIHLVTALALYGVVRQTVLLRFGSTIGPVHATLLSMVIATIWAIHPLTTDTVVYVSNRTEGLMTMFAVLTMWCASRSWSSLNAWVWNAMAIVFCLLGMLSKEAMAAVPLLVILYDWIFSRKPWRDLWRERRALWIGLALIWIPLALVVMSGARSQSVGFKLGITGWQYLMTQAGAVLTYLKRSIWPASLTIRYDTPVVNDWHEALVPGLIIIALLLGTAWAVWKRHWLGMTGAWFFLILAPSSSFIPLVTELVTERRAYAPLAAVVIVVLAGGDALLGWLQKHAGLSALVSRGVAWLAVIACCIALVRATMLRVTDYRSEVAIWQDAALKSPRSYDVFTNLGESLRAANDLTGAIKAFEVALKIDPLRPEVQSNVGIVCATLGRYDDASRHFRIAVDLRPDDPEALNNLAYLLATCPDARIRNGAQAVELAGHACSVAPDNPSLMDTLAAALAEAGRFDEAVQAAQRAASAASAQGNAALVDLINSRLALYRQRQPYHEP